MHRDYRFAVCGVLPTLEPFFWEPVAPCAPSWHVELCYEVMERLQFREETKKGGVQENSTIFSKNKDRNRGSKSPKAQSLLLSVLESTRNHRVFANEDTTEPRSESICSLCSSGPNLASPQPFTAGASSFIPHLGYLE